MYFIFGFRTMIFNELANIKLYLVIQQLHNNILPKTIQTPTHWANFCFIVHIQPIAPASTERRRPPGVQIPTRPIGWHLDSRGICCFFVLPSWLLPFDPHNYVICSIVPATLFPSCRLTFATGAFTVDAPNAMTQASFQCFHYGWFTLCLQETLRFTT